MNSSTPSTVSDHGTRSDYEQESAQRLGQAAPSPGVVDVQEIVADECQQKPKHLMNEPSRGGAKQPFSKPVRLKALEDADMNHHPDD